MIRKTVLWILCWVHAAAAGTHSLRCFGVATSEGSELPEYVHVDMVDDVQLSYYDSTMEKPVLQQDWLNNTMGHEFWDRQTWYILSDHDIIKRSLRNAIQHFNHTGVHTYQGIGGCELDDDGTRRAYWYHAYDGKDFISLDVKTLTWVASVPQAVYYKSKQEADAALQQILFHYYRQECFQTLKGYIQYGMKTLQRKVRPEVMLIQRKARKSAGMDVICHVTGFYPREVEVNWIRDGDHVLEEGVWSGEVLPNGDTTYQLRKTLTVSPEDQKKHSYSCQVDHASLDEKMDVKWVPEAGLNMWLVAGGVLAALGLIAMIIGALIWRKRASGVRSPDYTPAQRIQCSQSTTSLPDEDVQKDTAAVSMPSLAGSAEEARGFDLKFDIHSPR
ncbi:major histocompatibility complex class I-related gene protein-like isoform X2 [Acipenser ruthenus]|uniref:major histocompatibility complex class I-related gene protein-like isoform X2 n=1 Tax=Acipenser ruthenus TaxID=7906 RepID=UPI0027412787|nr:major histocompatibility complex class I-related gene protein-like isoform X2 [Acipenser ruthenus]